MERTKFNRTASLIVALLMVMFAALVPVTSALAESEGTELVIDDSSYSLTQYLNNAPEATIIKISTSNLGFSGGGINECTLPTRITKIQGWQKKTFFDPEGAVQRTLGNPKISEQKMTIPSGSNVTIKNINFTLNADNALVIEKGATVKFEDCSFQSTLENNGTATFTNCTFKNGKINNNGTVSYTGTTEPENIGKASTGPSKTPLSLSVNDEKMSGVVGTEFSLTRTTERGGSNKDTASWTATIAPEGSGLTATWEEDTVSVSGTPATAGDYTITLTGTDGTDTVTKSIPLKINDEIEVVIAGGDFPDLASNQDATSADGVTGASQGGGNSKAAAAPKLRLKYGTNGKLMDYVEFTREHSDADIKVGFAVKGPDGHKFNAHLLYDSIYITGESAIPGKYSVVATVTYDGVEYTSNAKEFNVFDLNVSFADRLKALSSDVTDWMMAPWKMMNTKGGATIPVNLKTISGSNESGLYGEIGNTDSVATDDIIIPTGADVTFKNMKFLRSTRIIVEKGAKFTLDDSATYGPIVVNGGTFSAKNSSTAIGGITLNDGSTLENADIKGSYYLTDGNDNLVYPGTLITTNGNVTVKGENTLKGSLGGGASLPGQSALKVNGTLNLEDGSVLDATGGGDQITPYAPYGGDAIVLNNGKIIGNGKVVATGGSTNYLNGGGDAGNAISGSGIVDVDELIAKGGDSGTPDNAFGQGKGGNATTSDVKVRANKLTSQGGSGSTPGSSQPVPYDGIEDDNPTTPTNPTTPRVPIIPETPDQPATPVTPFQHLKVTKSGKATKLSWSKVNGADGYDVYVSRTGKHLKKYSSVNATSIKIKGLKNGKAYKFRVKAYQVKDGVKTTLSKTPLLISLAGKGYNSSTTNAKTLKVTPKTMNLKVGDTSKLKAKATKVKAGRTLLSYANTPALRYISGNTEIATTSSNGEVKAVAEGSCKVYVYTANGIRKTVTINVSK